METVCGLVISCLKQSTDQNTWSDEHLRKETAIHYATLIPIGIHALYLQMLYPQY